MRDIKEVFHESVLIFVVPGSKYTERTDMSYMKSLPWFSDLGCLSNKHEGKEYFFSSSFLLSILFGSPRSLLLYLIQFLIFLVSFTRNVCANYHNTCCFMYLHICVTLYTHTRTDTQFGTKSSQKQKEEEMNESTILHIHQLLFLTNTFWTLITSEFYK